jgi:hypothetical protein
VSAEAQPAKTITTITEIHLQNIDENGSDIDYAEKPSKFHILFQNAAQTG